MIFQIFKIRKYIRDSKKGITDPVGFTGEQIGESILEVFLIFVTPSFLILVLLFLMAYTGFLGGPYGLAKFFFWLILIIGTIASYIFYKVFQGIKTIANKIKNRKAPPLNVKVTDVASSNQLQEPKN